MTVFPSPWWKRNSSSAIPPKAVVPHCLVLPKALRQGYMWSHLETEWTGGSMPLYSLISSLACSSFALPCQNARRRGYSVGEVGVDPELLPSRESNRSIQNGEARGELSCVPRVRAWASGRAIPIQRMCLYMRNVYMRVLIIIAIYNARCKCRVQSSGETKTVLIAACWWCCTRNQRGQHVSASHHPSAIKYWEKGEKAMERKLRWVLIKQCNHHTCITCGGVWARTVPPGQQPCWSIHPRQCLRCSPPHVNSHVQVWVCLWCLVSVNYV